MQPLDNGRYDSVAEFVASLDELRCDKNNKDYWNNSGYGASWLGANCVTANDVKRIMRDGWKEGQDAVARMIAQTGTTDATPIDRRRKLTRAELGDQLDIHSVYRGEFATAWTVARRRATRGPQHIDILANMICRGSDSASVLQWRGVAAITLADKLEAAGYRVRIVVGFGGSTTHSNEKVSCRITVKDHGAPIDIATSAAVTLPGFFRALGHQWTVNHATQCVHDGGMSVEQCIIEPDEIVLSHGVKSESTATQWVNKQIEALNNQAAA